MPLSDILPVIEQTLGFKLTVIPDIQAHFDDPERYPDSYREVMTIEEEMVGSMYSRHAFSDKAGNFVGLNLFGCEITEEQLSFFEDKSLFPHFQHLLSLNLTQTKITRFSLGEQFPSIVYAAFNECPELQRINLAKDLSNLARLEITETAIEKLKIPEGYTRLFYADLASNKSLTEFRFGGPCPNLQLIFLRGCKISTFTLPEGFEELVHLYLNNNELTEIELKSKLPKLSTLQLRDNKLSEFKEEIFTLAPHLDSVFIGRNPLPEELSFRLEKIADQNHIHILKDHFAQRKIGELQPNNECKVLLIGNGKAGKTAIVNRIVNDEFNPKWDSTHGIALYPKEFKEYLLNLWDFGGQDIYHSTHRLFMQKNAIYILAWSVETEEEYTVHEITFSDGMKEKKRYKNYDLRYWLEYAKHLGDGSPMNVVQTKVGKDKKVDKSELGSAYKEAFKPSIAFHAVESSEDDSFVNGYEDLMESIYSQVKAIKKGNTTLAEPLHRIREYLRNKQKAGEKLLDHEEYMKVAREFGVQKPQEMLETWLFRSGVVYYRPNKFGGNIILDQGWAIEAIYTLFDRSKKIPYDIEKKKGVFTGAFLQEVWQPKYADEDTHRLFVDFMKSCDLCFEIDMGKERPSFQERVFMAPQLVQEDKPALIEVFWETQDFLYYRFSDDFIHEGVIHSFISKTAYLAKFIDIWRIGIQIQENDQSACIEAGKNEILVRVTKNGRPLLQKIRSLLRELQGAGGKEEVAFEAGNYQALDTSFFQGKQEIFSDMNVRGFYPSGSDEEQADWGHTDKGDGSTEFKSGQQLIAGPEDRDIIHRLETIEMKIEEISDKSFESSAKSKAKPILFISANPRYPNISTLAVDFELSRLKTEFVKGKYDEQFEFLFPEFAIDKANFLKISDNKPYILHFSGHGNTEGILIQDGNNKPKRVGNEFLEYFFRDLDGITELVVLNSCLSVNQAEAISSHVPFVVGTSCKIPDPLAIAFSEGLYNGLGEGIGIEKSIKRGVQSVAMENFKAKDFFKLWKKGEESPI